MTMRESWTDERLDDFRDRVDQRFDEVDRRFDDVDRRLDKVEGEVKELRREWNVKFERIDARLDSIQRSMALGAVTLAGSMLAGFAAISTLIATQL